jgi:hypothetical protein
MGVRVGARARAVVLGCVLGAALLVVPAVASAATKGFDVTNYSSYKLKLETVKAYPGLCQLMQCFESRPPTGEVIQPGANERWELYAPYSDRTGGWIYYSVFDGDRQVGTEEITLAYSYSAGAGMFSKCEPESAFARLTCAAEGWTIETNTVRFFDVAGSHRTIPASDPESQTRVLDGLCGEHPVDTALCDFTSLQGPEIGHLPARIIGVPFANCEKKELEPKITYKDLVSNTNSLDTTVGVKLESTFFGQKAEASLEIAYGHEWKTQQTYVYEAPMKLDPGELGWVTDTVPVTTYLGSYSIKFNDATIDIPDVAFHRPRDAKQHPGSWAINAAPMTDAEKKQNCSGRPDVGATRGGLVQVPASEIPTKKH